MKASCVVAAILFVAGFSACQRNATTEQSVSFNGIVYNGHQDPTTSLIINDGLCANAVVSCNNYPSSTKTNASGAYNLTVSAVRTFSAPNADSYSVQASANGKDETVTVYGKPGDSIHVRDIILYQHTTGAN
jgi:hypothetical protein